jgi:hypothetical protein
VSAKLATRILTGVVADQSAIIEGVPSAERNAEQWTLLSLSGSGANAKYSRYALDCLAQAILLSPDWSYPYTRALAMLTTTVNMGYRDAYEPLWSSGKPGLMPLIDLNQPRHRPGLFLHLAALRRPVHKTLFVLRCADFSAVNPSIPSCDFTLAGCTCISANQRTG